MIDITLIHMDPRPIKSIWYDGEDALEVFTYENGSRHVECVRCDYLGPACTSIRHAIRHHNIERDERAATHRAAQAATGGDHG